ncbi:MAG: Fic family protein [Terriglobia bacterium]
MSDAQPWSEFIGQETIDILYGEGIKRWGGAGSEPISGCIDAALGAAFTAEMYSADEDQTEGLVAGLIFAGYLLFYLATKHCYLDGNKRISWACAMFILLRLGLTVQAGEDEIVNFCLSVANGNIKQGSQVVNWLATRLVSIT